MPKFRAIASTVVGCALSTISLACAGPETRPALPPVAVRVDNPPPAELLACGKRPGPLPESEIALMRPQLRVALIAIAEALGANADRLDRLARWFDPTACPERR